MENEKLLFRETNAPDEIDMMHDFMCFMDFLVMLKIKWQSIWLNNMWENIMKLFFAVLSIFYVRTKIE